MRAYFVFIKAERETLRKRIESRQGHFMKVGMLDGQLATLEEPGEDEEARVVVVRGEDETEVQVEVASKWLREHVEGLEERMGIGR